MRLSSCKAAVAPAQMPQGTVRFGSRSAHKSDVSSPREINGRFRKSLTAAKGRELAATSYESCRSVVAVPAVRGNDRYYGALIRTSNSAKDR
jgi:hypothetical protein